MGFDRNIPTTERMNMTQIALRKPVNLLQMSILLDNGESLYLRIPIFWSEITTCFYCEICTPKNGYFVTATGKNSSEIQENFNKKIQSFLLQKNIRNEVISMFKRLEEWEQNE